MNEPDQSGLAVSDAADCARICHEVNHAYCTAISEIFRPDTWDRCDADTKASAINGVQAFFANPHWTPEDMHNNWMQFKQNHGWKYGPRKNDAKKTHPMLITYIYVPPEQRAKDALFIAVCRGYFDL